MVVDTQKAKIFYRRQIAFLKISNETNIAKTFADLLPQPKSHEGQLQRKDHHLKNEETGLSGSSFERKLFE